MPIPPFDGILNVLPPHLGDPRKIAHLSPYPCTLVELCERFATSPARCRILEGLLKLMGLDIHGFQWLDGSFVEDIETHEKRDPGDLDAVTFVSTPSDSKDLDALLAPRPELRSRQHVKGTYHVDHFWLPLGSAPTNLVALTRYWYGLFSHRRDRVWKGMLEIQLQDTGADDTARSVLVSRP